MQVNGLIVAAGEGERMGAETAKAFLDLNGQPLILHTLRRFAACKMVPKVVLVASQSRVADCEARLGSDPRLRESAWVVCSGGARRQDSVQLGLDHLDSDCEWVVIHDGARPLVSPGLIDRCVQVARNEGSVVVGLPSRDTIKVVAAGGTVQETPSRNALWEIQTPQVFPVGVIREAYRAHPPGLEVTDDAMLVERLGKPVKVLPGERTNIKITFPEDLLFAEALIRAGQISL